MVTGGVGALGVNITSTFFPSQYYRRRRRRRKKKKGGKRFEINTEKKKHVKTSSSTKTNKQNLKKTK
jgi:hypothetical protein